MPSATLLAGLEGSMQRFAQMRADDDSFTGLDRVDLATFLRLWRDVGGRIGQRKGDQIHWEDGQDETIPPYQLRYQSRDDHEQCTA